ncbi:MAG: bifunctional diaminohydroxyphosphoribosylaminopyrimidine deaminase/5-amino-6-(5-phosphoribosylamino)uracil reductase RibD [Betaproteobacteria bacterium]|nr:bifunctional diaminohydroxyphosphoribosylaminopyrimidine deaminase/5-amino-6-(5-phosphoribosylamino)uracil reductase RibD [Betaproteobacteria bacterium]NBY14678.1 bifunctional diaminohydroxyphosphoribosylaminopyrimidine deaminase/5-amino-6-(5-phosphoribosylamino)uracil reductase RibD [Betaproteobacteria bacterium]NCA15651.1 bifunctional diaminohydroxyphosphoribosylaminopyrimidine deaminase/5-amino-6-(5-phosphoribosylamino)uracil reductase RibD [Betaproteobacteria bacterium]
MFTPQETQFMTRALELAERGLWTTTPNPRVGCVVVRDGEVVGEGWHEKAGQAHAEVVALAAAGSRARGSSVFVTLEPCAHTGRVGPCVDALLQAGVASVVAAMEDPNPLVQGRGLARLRASGVSVRCGLLSQQAHDLNPGFVKRMVSGLPWVRAKSAISLDGRMALPNGRSQWITDEVCRKDGHLWRARACVIATGLGTFLKDSPMLTVRGIDTPRQPLRLLLDARLDVDSGSPFFSAPNAAVATTADLTQPDMRLRAERLRERGARVLDLPSVRGGPGGPVDLRALCERLAADGCNELHLESGGRLAGAFLQEDLIDEWLIYQAPVFLGEGAALAEPLGPFERLDQAPRWRLVEAVPMGDGQRIRLMRPSA